MLNPSKTSDPRFWRKWRDAGAVGDMHQAYIRKAKQDAQSYNATRPRTDDIPAEIRQNLERKLEDYKLHGRVTFDEDALRNLTLISEGDWQHASVYAGTAILDALQNRKGVITAEDIEKVNVFEAINLMVGGKDIWEEVKYIGTQVPNMFPEGVQIRRLLSLWDADRNKNAYDSAIDGKLPQYTLADKIQYVEQGLLGQPEVQIPFKYKPSKTEVEAVANSLAKFVSEQTGEPHEIRDMSSQFDVQYFVQSRGKAGVDALLNSPNYRVREDFAFGMEEAQGAVSIEREAGSRHDKRTLEMYMQSVKPQPQAK